MMKTNYQNTTTRVITLLVFSLIGFTAYTQTLSDGAAQLFKDAVTKLTIAEKNDIFKKSGIYYSKAKKEFFIGNNPNDEFDKLDVDLYVFDMNSDGVEEVLIVMCNFYFYGNVGCGFSFFIKANGAYRKEPDLGWGIAQPLTSKNKGYNDIEIGGPGMGPFPIYRWNGTKYAKFTGSIANKKEFSLKELQAEYRQRLGITTEPEEAVEAPIQEEVIAVENIQEEIVIEPMLTPEATYLFNNVKSKLTIAERNQLAAKAQVMDRDTTLKGTKIEVRCLPVDLNEDGTEEVFVHLKMTSLGIPANHYLFYTKNSAGLYEPCPGYIGSQIKVYKRTKNVNYPDLITGIPGFEREIWRWNGSAYSPLKKTQEIPDLVQKLKSIQDVSAEYKLSIKD